jgi:hypothetical protein
VATVLDISPANLAFGNATNNPAYNFLGNGAVNIGGTPWITGGQVNFNAGVAGFIEFVNRSAGNLGYKFYPSASGSGVNVMTLDSSGNLQVTNVCTASSFNATSARAMKQETGVPKDPSKILSQLRPILYKLLGGESVEQLGMVAEEVNEICPYLSNGRTIAYDRLAVLLLADWQEQREVLH